MWEPMRPGLLSRTDHLKELVPLTTQDGVLTTQFPKDPVEDLGPP